MKPPSKRIFSNIAMLTVSFSIFGAALLPSTSIASTVNYEFNFIGTGNSPGKATFSYDTATNQFSNFLIPWHITYAGGLRSYDHTFDFTYTANNVGSRIAPLNCPNAHTAAQQMFAFLSQEACAGVGKVYTPWSFSWQSTFYMSVNSGPVYPDAYQVVQDDGSVGFYPLGGASFSGYSTALKEVVQEVLPGDCFILNGIQACTNVTSNDVPEPSSLPLAGLAISILILARRWAAKVT